MSGINTGMLIVFAGVLVINIILFLFSKGKYDEYIEPLEKKSHPLKDFYPMGLFILDAVKYKFATRYDRGLLSKVAEISGHKYSEYYRKIHWANKLTYLLTGLLLLSLFGIAAGPDPAFGIFSIFVLAAVLYFTDYELNTKIKNRRTAIQIEFPDFLNKLTLLINAGMTVYRAWEKIVIENKKQAALYDELGLTISEIKGGKSEQQAYEDFAKRCRIPEITKFTAVIVQNLRKGSGEIISVLRLQANDCWEMRKNAAKRLGEEASTKLLLPMMLMFLAILLIVATPAVLSMQNFK